jgi:2-phosphoglycerate kinase
MHFANIESNEEDMSEKLLQRELSHVYWIGGSPCAGKSSIAKTLATTYGLRLYQADEAFSRHEKIVIAQQQPIFYRLTHLSTEELWMRPVELQVSEEFMLYHEEFPIILEDLLALPTSQPILAEGAAMLPACVIPQLLNPHHAIWIVPTAEFQLDHYRRRAWAKDIVKDCIYPERAFQNWMERDIRFATAIKNEVQQHGMSVIVVDGTHSLAENTEIVTQHFQLSHSF